MDRVDRTEESSAFAQDDHGHDHAEGGDREEPEADEEKGIVYVALRTQAVLGIETLPVTKGDLALTLDLNGTLRPKPENIHDVHSPVGGIVLELHAFPGDRVKSGDPLLTLQVAKILEWQEVVLHTHFEEKNWDRVRPLVQAEGEAEMIEFLGSLQAKSAETRHFQEELDILRAAGQGAVSRQEIHHKEGELNAARADLLAKRALALAYGISQEQIDEFEQKLELPQNPKRLVAPQYLSQLTEKEIGLEKEQVLAETAIANLRAVGFPEDRIQLLQAGDSEALTDRLTLVSDSEGVIVESDARHRQAVTSEDHLFRIVDYRTVYLEAEVPEMDISRAVNRIPVEMAVQPLGMPDEILYATSVYLDTTVHPDRRIAHLVASMENLPEQTLREGMAVSVGMVIGYEEDVLVVPKSAVQKQGLENIVFVRDREHPEDFIRKEVRVGLSNLNEVEISGGLQEGEEVAVEGAFHLLLALQQASGEGKEMDHGHAHH
jgi:multidrug efflux pump subunit AcrA (membrane-fusion protein)